MLKTSKLYDTYWKFAFKRQESLTRRLAGKPFPWVSDEILETYRFTNCYRVTDRVSQYLVKNVIYSDSFSDKDYFFRIMLFKLFNSIETWESLENRFGVLSVDNFNAATFNKHLSDEMKKGKKIFSSAYIMPSRSGNLSSSVKHENLTALLKIMLKDQAHLRLQDCNSLKECFDYIKAFPLMGDFLAYQYVIDLNYSPLIDHSESEFVVAGPGAKDGIIKCFTDRGNFSFEDVIKFVTERQEAELNRLCLDFKYLENRRLQLIDCQNIFCEISKYSRISHPDIVGIANRHRIKRKYEFKKGLEKLFLPPKWKSGSSLTSTAPKELGREQVHA